MLSDTQWLRDPYATVSVLYHEMFLLHLWANIILTPQKPQDFQKLIANKYCFHQITFGCKTSSQTFSNNDINKNDNNNRRRKRKLVKKTLKPAI